MAPGPEDAGRPAPGTRLRVPSPGRRGRGPEHRRGSWPVTRRVPATPSSPHRAQGTPGPHGRSPLPSCLVMAPSVPGWGSRWILWKPWTCRTVCGWFRGSEGRRTGRREALSRGAVVTDTASLPGQSRDVGTPREGVPLHRELVSLCSGHSLLLGEPRGAPGGQASIQPTCGAAHTSASSATHPTWGNSSSGGVVEPCGAGRGERGFPAPHRRPLLREVTPLIASPRLRPGLLPFTLDPQLRRSGPGLRPEGLQGLSWGLGALVVTPSGL